MNVSNNFTRKRWLVLVLYGIINLCVGALYAWSIFAVPLQAELNVGSLSMVYTVATSIGPVTMIGGGFLQRKLKVKWVLLLSGIVFGLGMLLSGFATGQGFLLITYGLGAGLGAGLAYGCTVGNAVKLFPDKRGLAGGIAAATYGGSAIMIPPIANALIERIGVMNSFRVLGAVFLVVVAVCALLVEECPEGFVPNGWTPPEGRPLSDGLHWKQMVTTPSFYVMLLLLMCGAVSGAMTISQTSAMGQQLVGMGAATAAAMVSMLAAFNAGGRIVSGMLSDKIGRIKTLMLMQCVSLAGIVLLALTEPGGYLTFGIGIACIGVGYGAFLGVFPGFTADRFGQKHQSINYGVMFIGFSIAGLIGPNVASAVHESSGSYHIAFVVAASLCVAGLVLAVVFQMVYMRGNRK